MKAESTTLARQRETTYDEEKEKTKTNEDFFLLFVIGLTYLFTCFVSSAVHLLRDPFTELNTKWGQKTSAVLTLPHLVLNWPSLPHSIRLPTTFQNQVVPILPPSIVEGLYLFLVIPHLRRRFGNPVFSSHFIHRSQAHLPDWRTTST